MSDCLFCKIIAGEIPSSKVYEDELCYAFNDIAPQAPTHFLVVPKAHIQSVSAVTAENSAVVAHIFEVIAKLSKELGFDEAGYRVVSNIGEAGQQSVPHLHFHVLAGRDMTWPPGGLSEKRCGTLYAPRTVCFRWSGVSGERKHLPLAFNFLIWTKDWRSV